MLTKRTNILFDMELWNILTDTAKKEHTSVGKLVRVALKEKYAQKKRLQQRKEAAQAILAFREKYGEKLAKGEDTTTIIRKMRDQRYGKSHLRRLGDR